MNQTKELVFTRTSIEDGRLEAQPGRLFPVHRQALFLLAVAYRWRIRGILFFFSALELVSMRCLPSKHQNIAGGKSVGGGAVCRAQRKICAGRHSHLIIPQNSSQMNAHLCHDAGRWGPPAAGACKTDLPAGTC